MEENAYNISLFAFLSFKSPAFSIPSFLSHEKWNQGSLGDTHVKRKNKEGEGKTQLKKILFPQHFSQWKRKSK